MKFVDERKHALQAMKMSRMPDLLIKSLACCLLGAVHGLFSFYLAAFKDILFNLSRRHDPLECSSGARDANSKRWTLA